MRAFRQQWAETLALLAAGGDGPAVESTVLAQRFMRSDLPVEPLTLDRYLDFLLTDVVPYVAPVASPRCLGHMTSVVPPVLASVAELVTALNQNMVKRDASRVLTLIERQTHALLHRLIFRLDDPFYERHTQREPSALGITTTGGTCSNLTALWIARNRAFPPTGRYAGVEQHGIAGALEAHGVTRGVVLGSRLMHYSIEKAASVLGLGASSCITLPTDERHRVDVRSLNQAIAASNARRERIVAIVGVAGTTDAGSIDPLSDLAAAAHDAGTHFHVDGAWGAPLIFARAQAHRLTGLERADSVTIDGHKLMYLPVSQSVLLLRDPHAASVIEKTTRYMLHPDAGDLGARALEGSRPCSAVLLHAALHLIGPRGYERLIERSLALAGVMADAIRKRDEFELLVAPETSILLYRYVSTAWAASAAHGLLTRRQNGQLDAINQRIQRAQTDAGRSHVSRIIVDYPCEGARIPITAFRVVLTNPLTTAADLKAVLDQQAALAADAAEMDITSHDAPARVRAAL